MRAVSIRCSSPLVMGDSSYQEVTIARLSCGMGAGSSTTAHCGLSSAFRQGIGTTSYVQTLWTTAAKSSHVLRTVLSACLWRRRTMIAANEFCFAAVTCFTASRGETVRRCQLSGARRSCSRRATRVKSIASIPGAGAATVCAGRGTGAAYRPPLAPLSACSRRARQRCACDRGWAGPAAGAR